MPYDFHPRPGDATICHLKEVVRDPRIQVGDFTYYHHFGDPTRFDDGTIRSALPVLTGGTGQELADLVARLRG